MKIIPASLAAVFLIWSVASASQYRTVPEPVTVEDSYTGFPLVKGKAPKGRFPHLLPPATVLDSSYYDWQRNQSLNKRIWVNDDGSIHATYMVSPDDEFIERGMKYYYADQFGSAFSPPIEVTTFRNGYGNISSYPTTSPMGAIAVLTTHNFGTVASFACIDAYQGLGAFSIFPTDSVEQVVWPKPSVNADGSITIVGTLMNDLTVNGIAHNVAYDRAEDSSSGFSLTWTWFGQDAARWSGAVMEFPSIGSGQNGRVGIAIADFAADLHFYESTDNGITFEESIITNAQQDTLDLPTDPDPGATVFLPWGNSDIIYVGEEPHIVWTGLQGARVGGQVGLYDFGARILHWSPSTGIDTAVVASYQSAIPAETTFVDGGLNHTAVDWPQIGSSADGSVLYVVYVAFTPHDVDVMTGLGYGDIWGLFSVDNGETWSEPINISNPDGMYPGTDDRYPSISPVNYEAPIEPGMDAYIAYQSDASAGSFLQGEEAANWDFFLFTGIDFDVPSHIEDGETEGGPLPKSFVLHQNYPNPFNPSTTVSFGVPEGTDRLNLSIYNTRGKLVRTLYAGKIMPGEHQLTWDGRDDKGQATASGIYFLKLKSDRASRTIKMVMIK